MSKNTKNEKKNLIINNKTEKIDTFNFSKDKIAFFQNMISKSSLSVQKYKNMDILSANELNRYTLALEDLYNDLNNLNIVITKKMLILTTLSINFKK